MRCRVSTCPASSRTSRTKRGEASEWIVSVKVDAKGRLSIPRSRRDELHIEPGDTLLLQGVENALRYVKPNLDEIFTGLAAQALVEYQAGRTRDIEDIAAELGISLDDDRAG